MNAITMLRLDNRINFFSLIDERFVKLKFLRRKPVDPAEDNQDFVDVDHSCSTGLQLLFTIDHCLPLSDKKTLHFVRQFIAHKRR